MKTFGPKIKVLEVIVKFIICNLREILLWTGKKDETGGACNADEDVYM
jgi:hypothetical protein